MDRVTAAVGVGQQLGLSMSEDVDLGRRRLLVQATALTGAAGAVLAATPFLASWKPSARAKALGAPIEIDISKLRQPG